MRLIVMPDAGLITLTIFAGVAAFLLYSGSVTAVMSRCTNAAPGYESACFEHATLNILARRGLPDALHLVAQVGASDPRFVDDCHGLMHELGTDAYGLYAAHVPARITADASVCNFGFYHGFMEEMFRQEGSLARAGLFCDKVGADLKDAGAVASNCYHGIGHGTVDGYDPRQWGNPAALVEPGLARCKQVTSDPEYLSSCELGAFNSVELMYESHKFKLDDHGDPYIACRGDYDAVEKRACYIEMSVYAVQKAEGQYDRLLTYAGAVEPAYRAVAETYATVYEFSRRPDPDAIFSMCLARTNSTADCLRGILTGTVTYGYPGHTYDEAISFCTNGKVPDDDRRTCAQILLDLQGKTAQERIQACAAFPTVDSAQCKGIRG